MNRPAKLPDDPHAASEMVVVPHESRRLFDTLFAEPRHFRGDCRLARTAIRRGWIKPEDRDAFVERLEQVTLPSAEAHAAPDYSWRRVRGGVNLILEMDSANERAERYVNPFGWPERTTGRPRRSWCVSDYAERLDAGRVRAELLQCPNPWGTDSIDVTHGEPVGPSRTERVRLLLEGNASRRRMRVLLACPRCKGWRRFLYLTKGGIGCRTCLRLVYRQMPEGNGSGEHSPAESQPTPTPQPQRPPPSA